jgi:hypothetical protein
MEQTIPHPCHVAERIRRVRTPTGGRRRRDSVLQRGSVARACTRMPSTIAAAKCVVKTEVTKKKTEGKPTVDLVWRHG